MKRALQALWLLSVACGSSVPNPDGGSGGGTAAGGGTSSAGGGATGGGAGGGAGQCLAGTFVQSVSNKNRLLVGATMGDAEAAKAPWDVRYIYIASALFDSSAPCASCASNCATSGDSCQGGSCFWWGCYQSDQEAPGKYALDFVQKAKAAGQLPMLTYYVWLFGSKMNEGPGYTAAADNLGFLTRYLGDWRLLMQKVGQEKALIHFEPDLLGYAQQYAKSNYGGDITKVPAKVKAANPTDCGDQPDSFAGLMKCIQAMTRKYAPNAKFALHVSTWGTTVDFDSNTNPAYDFAPRVAELKEFLTAVGGNTADFLVVECSDRDAGYYQSLGQTKAFWDATNQTLPNFTQHFKWTRLVAESMNKALVWWQVPVGNSQMNNTALKWKDNRVEYFFAHPDEIVKAHGAIVAFGAGEAQQTTPATDNGVLINAVKAYVMAGGTAVCQ